jgi:L-malate glycosyltransferase
MKVKILHCIETIGSGGVEQRRLLLARFLNPEDFEQHLICSKVLANFDKRLEAFGVKVSPIGEMRKVFNLGYYRRLFKVVSKYRPGIIHGGVFEGVISAVVAGLFFKVPIIIIEETSDPQNRSWRGNLLMKVFSRFADYTIGISPSVVSYLRDTVHVPERKLRLINNGVIAPKYPDRGEVEVLRKSLGITDNDFVFGSVGRMRDFHKRFSDLIRAIALVKEDFPGFKLMIVGDGEDRQYLERLSEELGVADRIIFAGFQGNTAPYYACMDVFALASHMEGFGLVLIEAMFFQLPIIATAVGGMKDIVLHNETGLLVDRHSPESISKAMVLLYKNPALRKAMGEKGLERATKEYSAEVYVRNVQQLYQEACERRGLR